MLPQRLTFCHQSMETQSSPPNQTYIGLLFSIYSAIFARQIDIGFIIIVICIMHFVLCVWALSLRVICQLESHTHTHTHNQKAKYRSRNTCSALVFVVIVWSSVCYQHHQLSYLADMWLGASNCFFIHTSLVYFPKQKTITYKHTAYVCYKLHNPYNLLVELAKFQFSHPTSVCNKFRLCVCIIECHRIIC